jgi:nifR3 family TIM-barrel protein
MMRIGNLTLQNRMILAPLAGITDLPFRRVVKQAGCALVYSEMTSANGLARGVYKTMAMLTSHSDEKPLALQIFGVDPAIMADAASIAATAGADVLDINFGCSVRKVLKAGAGAALMREPQRAAEILRQVRRAVDIPLTIKIRSGWSPDGAQALRIGAIAQDCGVDAVALHPRTAVQGFRGKADWSLITALKARLQIPVIGNGDVTTPRDAVQMLTTTGCDGVMIGRAAIGYPWIFKQIQAELNHAPPVAVDPDERFVAMRRYLEASIAYRGEPQACRMLRSRLAWFARGMPHSSRFREAIKHIASRQDALGCIHRYQNAVAAYDSRRRSKA